MENTNLSSGIFDVKVTEDSIPFILKFVRLVRIGILLDASILVINAIIEIRRHLRYDYSVFQKKPLLFFETKLYPYYYVCHTVLTVLLLIMYWHIGKSFKVGFLNNDEKQFNEGFRYLHSYQVYSIVILILSFALHIIDSIIEFLYY